MKNYWQVVYDMLHSNGFGYDEENNCATTNAPGVSFNVIIVLIYFNVNNVLKVAKVLCSVFCFTFNM